jgi:hypothetical protein
MGAKGGGRRHGRSVTDWGVTEDGKELKMDLRVVRINDIVEEVDRHSRLLARKEDLYG